MKPAAESVAARPRALRDRSSTLLVIALGGGLGSVARYGLVRAWRAPSAMVPWSTLTINIAGSFLLGALIVAVTEVWVVHPLLRPALGTGVLGGFTTFSSFALQIRDLAADQAGAAALAYLLISILGGVSAALLGMVGTRSIASIRGNGASRPATGYVDPFDPDLP